MFSKQGQAEKGLLPNLKSDNKMHDFLCPKIVPNSFVGFSVKLMVTGFIFWDGCIKDTLKFGR